ncbi:MAG: PAS domain S-box protein, partial [Candidatus Cloacimonadota bacterium]|nr:PAS domain S-box protein [Candidatus Cloacimonadota bacterium]
MIEAIIEDNPNPILIYKNNNWVYLNLAFSNLFGFSLAELNRNDFYQLIAANLDDSVEFSNAIKNENNYKCEYIVNLKTEQGNDILCNISFKTLKSNDERYNIFILNNNSKVADARKKLKESKDFNLFLMQNTGDFIWILNQFNVIEFIAESVTEKLEFSVDELVDKNIEDILSEESKKELDRIEKEIAEDSAPKFIILEFMNKRKHRLLFETDVKPLIVNGEIKGYLGISRDLSNKMIEFQTHNIYKKISKAVLSNIMLTELYKIIREEIGNVIKSPNFVLAMYDEKNEMLNIPYMEDEFDNFEKIPMKGTISSLVIKEKKSMMLNEIELLKLTEEGKIEQVGAMCKLWLGTPLIVEEKVMGIIMIQSYQDRNAFSDKHKEFLETISNQIALFIKQKSILQELKEEGQKFRSIAENLPGVIYVYDVLSDGTRKPVYIGPGLEDFIDKDDFNYSDPMQSFCKMISDEDKKLIEGSTADEQEKLDINYQLTTNDNHNVTWVRSISSSIKMENNVDRIIGIILNITDRVKYQNRIAESENKFRLIVENSSDAIIIYNKFHEVVECNNASCKMYDYTKDEMLTKT